MENLGILKNEVQCSEKFHIDNKNEVVQLEIEPNVQEEEIIGAWVI